MEKYPHYLERLQNATRKYWNKPALNNIGGESFTYAQMARSIARFHTLFEYAGINKGDRIALCAQNGARWGFAYLAVNTYETVIVPILADFKPESVMGLVNHSDSILLFTDSDKFSKIDPAKMPQVRAVIDVNTLTLLFCNDNKIEYAFEHLDELFDSKYPNGFGPDDVLFPTDNWDNLAVINYTSGSTGDPKGVMLTYRNFSANVDFDQRFMPAGDKIVSMLPMAHMYGLVLEFIYPLSNGTSIYWLGKAPTPTTLLKAFDTVKPYLFLSVPLVMEKIYKSKIKPMLDKKSIQIALKIPILNSIIYSKIRNGLLNAFGGNVREFILGGAALNPEVERILKKIKFPYLVGYGMTEACPLLTYSDWKHYVPGSCGRPIDMVEIRIDSEDPHNVVGEIQARGENITIGYYNNPEATANAFTDDGWLRTGDLGVVDANGNIFIRGRSKNMILGPSGQNIYPEEIEAVVNNQDYVLESVVVERGVGRLVALVYLDEQLIAKSLLDDEAKDAIPENIRLASNRQLPAYCQLTKVELQKAPFEKTPKMSIRRFLYK